MLRATHLFAWFGGLCLLGLAAHAGWASEPRAVFAIKDGWVELTLRQEGKPVADAVIQIIDKQGKVFAEGETDADGSASFPAPTGESFLVEIKTGQESADPIRLYRTKAGIEPSRVLLSYGLRACCRFLADGEKPSPVSLVNGADAPQADVEPEPFENAELPWPWLAGGSLLLAAAAVLLAVTRRRRRPSEPGPPARSDA